MQTVWLLLGMGLLGATLVDVFLTALNFDEAGVIAGRLTRGQWRLLRHVTRRVPRRWRPVVLRQVTGLQVVVVITAWLFGIVTGFALVYYGLMSASSFSVAGRGAGLTLFDALYFSAAQMATVGGSSLTAETDLLRFLSIAESFSGVILISLILTFLLGVYSVIDDLNGLCRHFYSAERGAGSPVAALAPYFPDGEPTGLDGHLDGIAASFSSYVDGLRMHGAAYYFQSGRDQFALPYAVRMLAGTLAALRWGLPASHPAAREPALVPLTFQFLLFGDHLDQRIPWRSPALPETVSAEEFAALVRDPRQLGRDPWVARFVELDAAMARLARIEPMVDLDEAYARYLRWLPFAFRAQRITLALSADLDYQPVIVSDRPVSLLRPEDAVALASVDETAAAAVLPAATDPEARDRIARWRAFARRHLARTDPGDARLRAATRAVLAASATVATLALALEPTGRDGLQAATFGGFVAMLSTGAAVGRTERERRVASVLVLAVVPPLVVLGALVAVSPWLSGLMVVALAVASVALQRQGDRWAALGGVAFMVYYFALILRLDVEDVVLYVVAAVVGVAWAYLLNHVVLVDHPAVALRRGVEDHLRALGAAVDPVLDAVSWARWDAEVRKHIDGAVRRVRRHVSFISGQLADDEERTGVPGTRASLTRMLLVDTELGFMELIATVRGVTGTEVPLEVRARLAGRLERLRAHLEAMSEHGHPVAAPGEPPARPLTPWVVADAPAAWPRAARRVHAAIDHLYAAADRLSTEAALAGTPGPDEPVTEIPTAGPDAGVPAATGTRALGPVTRRAVQAGVAAAASLVLGWAVSTTHQYWATLSAYQVLGETDGETVVRGVRRVAGTVAGALLGFGVVLSGIGHAEVVLPLLAVAVFGMTYCRQVSPGLTVFWATTIFALLYGYLGRLTDLALEQRVLETVVGALVALATAFLVLPTRTRRALGADLASLVGEVDDLVGRSLGELAGDQPAPGAQTRERLLELNRQVRRLGATVDPLRRAPGARADDGIDAALTTVWSLADHTRRLVRAAGRAEAVGVGPADADWRELARGTSQNVAALTQVFAGELPGPADPELGTYDGPSEGERGEAVDAVMREVLRVNEGLVGLLEQISPGAVVTR